MFSKEYSNLKDYTAMIDSHIQSYLSGLKQNTPPPWKKGVLSF